MFRFASLCSVLFLFASLAFVDASPDRPDKKPLPQPMPKGETPTIPDLNMESNWGKVEQVGRNLKITGHSHWEALGEIRPDGYVYLLWTLLSNGDPAPSVYKVVKTDAGIELQGLWNFGANLTVRDGKIEGLDRPDVVRKILPPDPDF